MSVDKIKCLHYNEGMFRYEPLAKTLKERGITLDILAKETGIRSSLLVAKLNGEEYLPCEYIDRICTFLNVPVEQVMMWKKGEQKGGERIKVNWQAVQAIAEMNGKSFGKLGEECRMSRGALSRAKTRNGTLKKQNVALLVKALGCKLEDIVD